MLTKLWMTYDDDVYAQIGYIRAVFWPCLVSKVGWLFEGCRRSVMVSHMLMLERYFVRVDREIDGW